MAERLVPRFRLVRAALAHPHHQQHPAKTLRQSHIRHTTLFHEVRSHITIRLAVNLISYSSLFHIFIHVSWSVHVTVKDLLCKWQWFAVQESVCMFACVFESPGASERLPASFHPCWRCLWLIILQQTAGRSPAGTRHCCDFNRLVRLRLSQDQHFSKLHQHELLSRV